MTDCRASLFLRHFTLRFAQRVGGTREQDDFHSQKSPNVWGSIYTPVARFTSRRKYTFFSLTDVMSSASVSAETREYVVSSECLGKLFVSNLICPGGTGIFFSQLILSVSERGLYMGIMGIIVGRHER